jgi:soluble P-type ATPase
VFHIESLYLYRKLKKVKAKQPFGLVQRLCSALPNPFLLLPRSRRFAQKEECMIQIDVPGFGELRLSHLVMDYNGTMACDGRLIDGVEALVRKVAQDLEVHVVTADTFGRVAQAVEGLPVSLHILGRKAQDLAKKEYVTTLGTSAVVSMGNGRNDGPMLKASRLGIALVQDEGASVTTLVSADIVCKEISHALALLLNPERLVATLRT